MNRRRRRLLFGSSPAAFAYIYLVDNLGNNITDESGNKIVIKKRI